MSLQITTGSLVLTHKTWLYPGGEVGVRLDTDNLRYKCAVPNVHTIWARIRSSNDLMELVMVVDALRRWDCRPINLVLPYVPYGRQDRACIKGEALSLRAFAAIVNSLGFTQVTTFDPHSEVTGAVLENVVTISQVDIIGRFDALNKRILAGTPPIFVSPDAGANKKTSELAAFYGHSHFIRADKLRDLSTGKIKEIVVVNERTDVEGQDCIIADDLCDAGGTFLGLATALRAKGATRVELYVTHGLFTKGTAPLYLGGINRIWTTNAYYETWPDGVSAEVETLRLEVAFSL